MTRSRLLAAGVTAIVLAACADPAPESPAGVPDSGPPRYQANTTVLESDAHGPELCFGGVADSLPPQCGGVPIANWDWDLADGEESLSGTTWGEFRVVGTYDGEAFTVEEVGEVRYPPSTRPDFTPPCPMPEGGWVAVAAARATDADLQAVMRAAEAEPDSAGFWISYVEPPTEETAPAGGIIAVAAFTGDLERHEADLRSIWGGPLCVTGLERTLIELERIQRELGADVGTGLGVQVTWSSIDVTGNVVELGVVLATDEIRAAIDERYGGAVDLRSELLPV
ncbi:MAG: hypothetical protein ACXWEH_06745 [Actinomycetota bacterium]